MGDRKDDGSDVRMRWARLRFSIVGPLLSAPPEHGDLRAALEGLAGRTWRHPTTDEALRFGVSTIERWLYLARNHPEDPVGALARKVRTGAGKRPSVTLEVAQAIRAQHRRHPGWTYKLHHDNLVAAFELGEGPGRLPSYTTLTRFMKERGLVRRKRRRRRGRREGTDFEVRERRSYEVRHVNGLWHADYHEGSRRVLRPDGGWATPYLFGALDDRSRVSPHLQWYLTESTETFDHGLSQGFLKRELPRALMTDNGGPMIAAETTEGLERLGIIHYPTLPKDPEANAKMENFWGRIEGRLLPMLEGERELTLELLNEATQAWVQQEYHREVHSEIGAAPLEVYLNESGVGRPSPSAEELRRVFRKQERRTQRRSDGTVTVGGVRFELPNRYRTLQRPTVRFARWDLSAIDLVDPRSGVHLCTLLPIDKHKNAERHRRSLLPPRVPEAAGGDPADDDDGIAPLLRKYMREHAATGLPPAYLPHRGPQLSETDPDEDS